MSDIYVQNPRLLHPAAQDLVRRYERVGTVMAPCDPAGLAAVLTAVAGLDAVQILELVALLRGERNP
jgi:hypothetical protein